MSTNSLVRKADEVVGVKLDSFKAVTEKRMLFKLHGILNNTTNALYQGLIQHRSTRSKRLVPPKCRTERHRRSFLPVVIRL